MPIEKVFAINAPPREIYAALERDIASAGDHIDNTFAVISREPPRLMQLRVTIGNIPCWLTYTIEERQGHSEVTATLVPFGWKYTMFKIVTLGLRDQNFEIALVEGLVNLKAAVEGGDEPAPPPDDEMTIDE